MIKHEEIKELVNEWRLREDVIEKDYVIGWVLWGIGSDPILREKWAFKGGTCLKKCLIETFRFSEDLDFTVLEGGPIVEEEVAPVLNNILKRIGDESGINFSAMPPKFKKTSYQGYLEARIYYVGPRNSRNPSSIKFDLLSTEKVVEPTVLNDISHPYSDTIPGQVQVRCYSFEELFAEKIRALGERCRPRDLYDVVFLFNRGDFQSHPEYIADILNRKCQSKGVPVPTYENLCASPFRPEVESEWGNMLNHQLQVLPDFNHFWNSLKDVFLWLDGRYVPETLESAPETIPTDRTWTPPPTTWRWGLGVPLESVRFAAANHLCVELDYRSAEGIRKKRIIEPYSLRKTSDDNIVLHAIRVDNRQHRSYRVDRIMGIRVTTTPFVPRYRIEFSQSGPVHAPRIPSRADSTSIRPPKPKTASSRPKPRSTYTGMKYKVKCSMCGKTFTRNSYDTKLNKHKNKYGMDCPGRHGYMV